MRWRRHRKADAEQQERDAALRCAQEQLRDAEHELEAVHERTSEIAEITRTLRKLRERNRFAPMVEEALGARR